MLAAMTSYITYNMKSYALRDWRASVKAFTVTAVCLGFIPTTRRVRMNCRVLQMHVHFDNDNVRKGIYLYITLYSSSSARRQPRKSPGLSRAKVRVEIKVVQKTINLKPAGREIIDITPSQQRGRSTSRPCPSLHYSRVGKTIEQVATMSINHGHVHRTHNSAGVHFDEATPRTPQFISFRSKMLSFFFLETMNLAVDCSAAGFKGTEMLAQGTGKWPGQHQEVQRAIQFSDRRETYPRSIHDAQLQPGAMQIALNALNRRFQVLFLTRAGQPKCCTMSHRLVWVVRYIDLPEICETFANFDIKMLKITHQMNGVKRVIAIIILKYICYNSSMIERQRGPCCDSITDVDCVFDLFQELPKRLSAESKAQHWSPGSKGCYSGKTVCSDAQVTI